MARYPYALVLALVVAATAVPVSAVMTEGEKQTAESLIKQFSAPEFDVRQQAVERLVKMGADVVPLLRKALDETTDNEVKLRCRMALKGLNAEEAESLAKKPVVDKFGMEGARVTLHLKNATLDSALQQLSEQSGNALIEAPGEGMGGGITLDLVDVPYWQALDKVAAAEGLMVAKNLGTGEFILMRIGDTVDVSAYAGPAVVKLGSITSTQRFRRTSGMEARIPGISGLHIRFAYFLEDRLQPLGIAGKVTKIVADGDRAVALDEVLGDDDETTTFFNAMASNPPANIAKLTAVEGIMRLTFGEGSKELKVANALGDGEPSGVAGKEKLTVTGTEHRNMGGPGDGLVLTVRYEVDGKPAPLPSVGRSPKFGIALIDPKGNRHPAMNSPVMRMMQGGIRILIGPGPDGNEEEVQVEGEGEDEGRGVAQIMFDNLPELNGAWSLVLTAPERITVKDYAFKFTDLPLR